MSKVVEATDATFEAEVLNADLPVLVDFWAEWCGPCRMLGPIVDELANDKNFTEKLKVVKFDVQNNQEMAIKYQIRAIPALKIFHKGEVAAEHTGVLSRPQLESFVNGVIDKA